MKRIQIPLFLFAAVITRESLAQTSPVAHDVRPNEVNAQQKQIANDLAYKSTLIPMKLPDATSMVSINQSGDGIISLPLVTVKGRKLTLPINLNYVTSGIKVDQTSSDVGLGWNISFGSITRDYGIYEPDYTYTGSEFAMLNEEDATYNGLLRCKRWVLESAGSPPGYYVDAVASRDPLFENKQLKYNNATGKAPDNYIVNIPGQEQNDFWNRSTNLSGPSDPDFIFSQLTPWRINYSKKVFKVSQEISRINEFTYAEADATHLKEKAHNLASAIALYPYVRQQEFTNMVMTPPDPGVLGDHCIAYDNLFDAALSTTPHSMCPNLDVKYEDYSQFIITISDGTQYVFGRPLRGQKYLFSEEPFWSAIRVLGAYMGSENKMVYNELWKTDFIAEWLLTEVRSNDYVDANGNGIADDEDKGDWIRIEYTSPFVVENTPGVACATTEPRHREFLNFTQTDRASSIWRERAYVTKIITPVQTIDFDASIRFDVNHDYFNMPFNRKGGEYKYQNTLLEMTSLSSDYYDAVTGVSYPPDIWANTTKVFYPIDLRRYDGLQVRENISAAANLVQNVHLNYAAKGSAQELAVSKYLILGNDTATFKPYDPADLGSTLLPANFLQTEGRGKTTLLGIDYRGTSTTSTNKISYSFNYDYNPSYDEIHKYQIWKQAAYPTVREALASDQLRWTGIKTREGGTQIIANSCTPYQTMYVDYTGFPHTPEGENYNMPVFEDEMGYYYNPGAGGSLNGRNAWSLTGIVLPYGGNIKIAYEPDAFDIDNDRLKWLEQNSFADYCLPLVGHYNNVASMRNIAQDKTNYFLAVGDYHLWPADKLLKLNDEFYFMMNANSGGLRVMNIKITPNYGAPTITKTYNYGTGHFTMPPADYLTNYMSAFGSFTEKERERHGINQLFTDLPPVVVSPNSDYNNTMSRLMADVRVDKSVMGQAVHFYEYIEEINADGGKTRWYYGQLKDNFTNPNPAQIGSLHLKSGAIKIMGTGSQDFNTTSYALTTDNDNQYKIGKYKTEIYDNASHLLTSEQTDYSFYEMAASNITFSGMSNPSHQYETFFVNWYISSPTGTVELQPSVYNPLGIACPIINFFQDNFSFDVMSYIGYNEYPTPPSGGLIPINSISECRNSFTKIAANAGNFSASYMPAWYYPILSLPAPWTTTSQQAAVFGSISSFMNFVTAGPTPSYFQPVTFNDDQYYQNSCTYKNQQCYRFLPTHTKKIANYY